MSTLLPSLPDDPSDRRRNEIALPTPVSDAVRRALDAALAKNTKRAYAGALRRFEEWCRAHGRQSCPASPETLAGYLVWVAEVGHTHKRGEREVTTPARPSTIQVALAAISQAHETLAAMGRIKEEDNPRHAFLVRKTWKGVRRLARGESRKRAAALLREDLHRVIAAISFVKDIEAEEGEEPTTVVDPLGYRDQAMILVGWSFALRISEVVAIDHGHLRFEPEGLRLLIPWSKTDQEGKGVELGLPVARGRQTIEALRAWLAQAGIGDGPVFRALGRETRITDRQAENVLARRFAAAGLGDEFSGHSLRAGWATQAVKDDVPLHAVMAHTRHKNVAVAMGYLRDATVFDMHKNWKGV